MEFLTKTESSQGFRSFHCPFSPGGPWAPGSLLAPFFQVPGVQSSPGCPGQLWLRHDHQDLGPRETQACREYQKYHHNREHEAAGLE